MAPRRMCRVHASHAELGGLEQRQVIEALDAILDAILEALDAILDAN